MAEIFPDTEIDNPLVVPFIEEIKKGPARWGCVFMDIMNILNFEPEYVQESFETSKDLREKLNTRAGILIANHPSSLDVGFIFAALLRPDILIMMQRKRFAFFEKVFGPEHVVAAPSGEEELAEVLRRAEDHIARGGLFIIFPSGGEEIRTGKLRFKSGFRLLLSRMLPEVMVYMMYIDRNAARIIMDESVGPPRRSDDTAILISPRLHMRPLKDRLKVKVNERYSEAREWQEVLGHASEKSSYEQNDLLMEYFLQRVAF